MIRIVIADDEAAIRASLQLLLTHEPGMSVVAEAADGRSAVAEARAHRPDVVLMDVQMPGITGLEATRTLCADPNGPRVIVLTTFDLDEFVYEALRAGASGFLLKNSPPSELVRAIRVVHAGEALLAPEVTRRLITRLAGTVAPGPSPITLLTPREQDTLRLIAQGRSNPEIAQTLVLTPTTVRTYVSRILAKLGARDRAQLVVIAYEHGLAGPGTSAL